MAFEFIAPNYLPEGFLETPAAISDGDGGIIMYFSQAPRLQSSGTLTIRESTRDELPTPTLPAFLPTPEFEATSVTLDDTKVTIIRRDIEQVSSAMFSADLDEFTLHVDITWPKGQQDDRARWEAEATKAFESIIDQD
jgi:hypothetical protein